MPPTDADNRERPAPDYPRGNQRGYGPHSGSGAGVLISTSTADRPGRAAARASKASAAARRISSSRNGPADSLCNNSRTVDSPSTDHVVADATRSVPGAARVASPHRALVDPVSQQRMALAEHSLGG